MHGKEIIIKLNEHCKCCCDDGWEKKKHTKHDEPIIALFFIVLKIRCDNQWTQTILYKRYSGRSKRKPNLLWFHAHGIFAAAATVIIVLCFIWFGSLNILHHSIAHSNRLVKRFLLSLQWNIFNCWNSFANVVLLLTSSRATEWMRDCNVTIIFSCYCLQDLMLLFGLVSFLTSLLGCVVRMYDINVCIIWHLCHTMSWDHIFRIKKNRSDSITVECLNFRHMTSTNHDNHLPCPFIYLNIFITAFFLLCFVFAERRFKENKKKKAE